MANIIITGASRGIGLEMTKIFADEGHNVLALSRNIAPIINLGDQYIRTFPFDVTKETDFDLLKEFLKANWSKVDVLINNAGMLLNRSFAETSLSAFKKVYDVNVFGVMELIKLVIPFMQKKGHIVNISSMGGVQGSVKFPGLAAYSSSKGALITLTELLAEEYKATGPSFNALALGAVQTEMLEEAFPGYRAPLSANEMAAYIVRFALSGNTYYNGKVLQVSSSTP